MFNKKISSELAIGLILILAIAVSGFFWWQGDKSSLIDNQSEQKTCMQEAKLCDDGSSVDRIGPNCEFAKCPKEKTKQQFNEGNLRELVNNFVEKKKSGVWDKKVTIESYSNDKTAAKGKWWAKDAWDWIAWQQDDGQWEVFANFEGAIASECNLLKNMPAKHKTFFQNIVNDPIINSCLKE
jgi:hypothetical protein